MTLTENFNKHFEIVLADTDELIREVQGLRHQVLCVENPYLNCEDYPDGLECDEYDSRSVHSLIVHKKSGLFAATVRLVLPDPVSLDAHFPIEGICEGISYNSIDSRSYLNRKVLAEISRFSISKGFKKKIMGEEISYRKPQSFERTRQHQDAHLYLPLLILGLFKAILNMSRKNGISHLLALAEPSLLRLLNRYGIYFQGVGEIVDFHGKRQPVFGTINTILQGIDTLNFEVSDFITEENKKGISMHMKKRTAETLSSYQIASTAC